MHFDVELSNRGSCNLGGGGGGGGFEVGGGGGGNPPLNPLDKTLQGLPQTELQILSHSQVV